MRHTGPVDFGIDVAHQVGLQVQVLDKRQRVWRVRFGRMAIEHLQGAELAISDLNFVLNKASRIGPRRMDTEWK